MIKLLQSKFKVKNLGEIKYYLGINIKRTEKGNFEKNQKMKIERLYENLKKEDRKPSNIPMKTIYLKEKDETRILKDNKRI